MVVALASDVDIMPDRKVGNAVHEAGQLATDAIKRLLRSRLLLEKRERVDPAITCSVCRH